MSDGRDWSDEYFTGNHDNLLMSSLLAQYGAYHLPGIE